MIEKQEITNELKKSLGRDAKADELTNAENDALLLAKILIKKMADLENRLYKLENK